MTVNLSKNEKVINDAFEKLAKCASGDEWILLDYEGQSNIIKLSDQGSDGLEELGNSFNSGRVQYGLISIKSCSTKEPKIVMIHWQGEGSSSSQIYSTAGHPEAIKRYFRRVHLLIHARDEIDLEKDAILKMVNKLGGVREDKNVQGSNSLPQETVHSVYQPVKPSRDINISERNNYWKKMNDEKELEKMLENKCKIESIPSKNNNYFEPEKVSSVYQPIKPNRDINLKEREEYWKKINEEEKEVKEDSVKIDNNLIKNRKNMFEKEIDNLKETKISSGLGNKMSYQNNTKKDDVGESIEVKKQSNILSTEQESINNKIILPSAIALWDYIAQDDTEISFDPNDIIQEIDQFDEGWWRGRAPNGHYGMFPSNFVKLLEN
uniref:Drebrin-like protein n=1 Tax=Parastrongyloides trichosuri TaxID=131310 RepID=A0A0N4Z9B7_PARTI